MCSLSSLFFFNQPDTSRWAAQVTTQHLPLIVLAVMLASCAMVGQRRCKRTLWHSGMEALRELVDDSRGWTLSLSGQALVDEHVVYVSCQLFLSCPSLFILSKKKVNVLVKRPSHFLLISTVSQQRTPYLQCCSMNAAWSKICILALIYGCRWTLAGSKHHGNYGWLLCKFAPKACSPLATKLYGV